MASISDLHMMIDKCTNIEVNIAGYFESPVRPSRVTVPVGVEP